MSNFFGKIFRSKNKNSNKENEDPIDRTLTHRASSRSTAKARRERDRGNMNTSAFVSRNDFDASFIPATAPYHTSTSVKYRRGPLSCPGGYKEDEIEERADRSFGSEFHPRAKRERHNGDYSRGHRSQRETSEYGSQDPSPTGHYSHRGSRGRGGGGYGMENHSQHSDQDDEEEYGNQQKIHELEHNCKLFIDRWKHAEGRHMYYKGELRTLQKAKDEAEKVYLQQISSLKKENQRNVARIKTLETILACRPGNSDAALSSTATSTTFESPPMQSSSKKHRQPLSSFPKPGYANVSHGSPPKLHFPEFPPLTTQNANNILSFHGSQLPSHHNTHDILDNSINGAGESLTEDVSHLAPPLNFENSFTRDLNFDVNHSMNDNEEKDEVKVFRGLDSESLLMEKPRSSGERRKSIGRTDSQKTVSLDDDYAVPQTVHRNTIRRYASDTDIVSPQRRHC